MRQEQIGNLRIGLLEEEVKNAIHCQLKRGTEELWGSDGIYHQEWRYVGCGVTLDMVSEKKGASKSIASISVIDPSDYTTKQGIRIGSTEEEVRKAYEFYWNQEDSTPETFVAGSIYGGLLFTFKSGRVVQLFLGPAAE